MANSTAPPRTDEERRAFIDACTPNEMTRMLDYLTGYATQGVDNAIAMIERARAAQAAHDACWCEYVDIGIGEQRCTEHPECPTHGNPDAIQDGGR